MSTNLSPDLVQVIEGAVFGLELYLEGGQGHVHVLYPWRGPSHPDHLVLSAEAERFLFDTHC